MLEDGTVWCVFVTYSNGDTNMLTAFSTMARAMDFKRKLVDMTMANVWVCGTGVDYFDGENLKIPQVANGIVEIANNIVERNHVDD